MSFQSSEGLTDADVAKAEAQEPVQMNDKSIQSQKNMSSQEKSLRITIRVPARPHSGRKSSRRRVGVLESATETEFEELSSLSDVNEDDEIALDESLDTDDTEMFAPPSHPQEALSGGSSRLTKRQRARIDEELSRTNDLVQLPETARKRHQTLTEEELALKKDELARRRKNLSEQKLEEEKMGTIHKLLNKQATHKYKRTKVGDVEGASDDEKNVPQASSPTMSRWLDTKEGTVFAVPKQWLNTSISFYFSPQKAPALPLPRPSCTSCGGIGIYTVIGSDASLRACSIPCIRSIQSRL
ncbi:hypothetical protein PORY_001600 [Pneumocystis oryctolagi]|uniref:Uncharacterized protein n=1 Tax=Pneumocystis oryctolagi TaxID=42067 RepID=A0ACB7CBR6_9ASCO|nr:hypothetical protein PORY_001600 [Pneumocystis oryctolagi]